MTLLEDDGLPPHKAWPLLFVGTHRRAHRADPEDIAFGIYAFRVDPSGGADSMMPCGMTHAAQPGWISVHPGGKFLYVVNEVRTIGGRDGGAVSAFTIDRENGTLSLLISRPLPPTPCHCAVDASGRFLIVATFGGGSVHLFPIEPDGGIGQECDRHIHSGSSLHPQRQTHPHAHAVLLSPDNRFVLVPDLGTDSLLIYGLDSGNGRLIPRPEKAVKLPPLSGPRHGVFAPDARHFYLINEMNATLTVYDWQAKEGRLVSIQAVDLLPPDFDGLRSGAAIEIHPSGRFLYATTRSHGSSGMPSKPGQDLLIWLHVDLYSGLLTLGDRMDSGGGIPRSIALSPDARQLHVAHQCSGNLVAFNLIDGVPSPTGQVTKTPVPVCMAFAPSPAD